MRYFFRVPVIDIVNPDTLREINQDLPLMFDVVEGPAALLLTLLALLACC